MIIVAGSIEVDPGDRATFLGISAEAVRLARSTVGCHDFAVSADPVESGRVNVFEAWEDRESLEAFRRGGPDDGLDSMILQTRVREFEVD